MPRIFRYHPATRSAVPPGEHLLVYDGDCGFCFKSAEFIRGRARTPLILIPFNDVNRLELLTSLDQSQFLRSAHFITPEGKEYHGGESITRALRLVRGGFVFGFLDVWGIALIREFGYTWMAGNRSIVSRLTRIFSRRGGI